MTTDETTQRPRSLMGLRPPAEPAERGRPTVASRPTYQTVSSGWDAEDESPNNTSLVAALGAGAALLVVLALLGWILY